MSEPLWTKNKTTAPPRYLYVRFIEKIKVVPSGCWEWQGTRHKKPNYGRFHHNGKEQMAHQVSYELFVGPRTALTLHKCDNPPCVNPEHLYQGTKADNTRDTIERGQYRRWFGEKSPVAKLNDNQVRRIRHLCLIDMHIEDIADKFSISKSHVWNIVSGKMRKDIL